MFPWYPRSDHVWQNFNLLAPSTRVKQGEDLTDRVGRRNIRKSRQQDLADEKLDWLVFEIDNRPGYPCHEKQTFNQVTNDWAEHHRSRRKVAGLSSCKSMIINISVCVYIYIYAHVQDYTFATGSYLYVYLLQDDCTFTKTPWLKGSGNDCGLSGTESKPSEAVLLEPRLKYSEIWTKHTHTHVCILCIYI